MGRLALGLVALAVFAAGCGEQQQQSVKGKEQKKDGEKVHKKEAKKEGDKKEEKKEPVVAVWKPSPKGPLKVRYQGIMADQWYEQMLDADGLVALAAAYALQEIGEEAVPYLEDAAINATSYLSRRAAIQHLPERLSKKCRASWVPMLRLSLKDEYETVRFAAARRMADFGYTECLADLEKLLVVEKDQAACDRLCRAIEQLSKNFKK